MSDDAKYWAAQAEMWHENYKGLMHVEEDLVVATEALKRIASLVQTGGTKERLRHVAVKALADLAEKG